MESLSQIYQRYSTVVYRFTLGLCGDSAWADDLTAETFVRALVSPRPIRLETVKAYLFTIARNLYLQDLRKKRRFVPLEDGLAHSAPGPEQHAESSDLLREALMALQQLEEVDRVALLMRAQQGIPYADIAQALGISLSSAKVKVHRARRKLARTLKE